MSGPHRILFLIDTLEMGGTERSLLEICKRLDPLKFTPIVCSIYQGNQLQEEFEAAGILVEPLNLKGRYQFWEARQRLSELTKSCRPDLIHSMLYRAGILSRILPDSSRIPLLTSLVAVPYDSIKLKFNPQLSWWKTQLLKGLDRLTARRCTHFHSVSESVKDSYMRHLHIREDRITVIPRGRAPQELEVPGASGLRALLGLAPTDRVLLNVGRLSRQKGQINLIHMMPSVLDEFPTARLLIAGDGELRGELESEIRRHGLSNHIRLLGTRRDIPELLDAAELFVFPTRYEGLPGSVIEAMLAGVPVVGSDIPMMRDLIVSGQDGILVPVNNPTQLANAVSRMLRQPAQARSMAAQSQEKAAREFDIDRVVKLTERLYHDLITRRAGRAMREETLVS